MATRPDLVAAVRHAIDAEEPLAVCTIVRGPRPAGTKILVRLDGVEGSTGDAPLDRAIVEEARKLLVEGRPRTFGFLDSEVFIDVMRPEPRLIIVGAVHIAVALCELATRAGFAVTVVDPRERLNNRERFPAARHLAVGWPQDELPALRFDSDTYVAVLTHDDKFDDPTLDHVLRTDARYIGAIGSKKTQAMRRARLLEAGFTEAMVDRLHAPIGLDIGAQTPEEIAVAILAEMIAAKHGRRGAPLSDRAEPHIHA